MGHYRTKISQAQDSVVICDCFCNAARQAFKVNDQPWNRKYVVASHEVMRHIKRGEGIHYTILHITFVYGLNKDYK